MVSNKDFWRKEFSRRKRVTHSWYHQRVRQHLRFLFQFFSPKRVAVYLPFPFEPDLLEWVGELRSQGIHLFLPTCLQGRWVWSLWKWEQNPPFLHTLTPYPKQYPEIAIVPVRLFDQYGTRLGSGRGVYDHLLRFVPMTIGVAFEWQRVRRLPRTPHDHPLDWIVTEKGIFPAGRKNSHLHITQGVSYVAIHRRNYRRDPFRNSPLLRSPSVRKEETRLPH